MEHRNSVLIVEDDVNINGLLKEALEKSYKKNYKHNIQNQNI